MPSDTTAPPTSPAVHPTGGASGPWLPLARVAWPAFALLTAGLYAVALPLRYEQLRVSCVVGTCYPEQARRLEVAGVSPDASAALTLAVATSFALACLALGALLLRRAATSRMALCIAFALVPFGTSLSGVIYQLGQRGGALGALASVVDSFNAGFLVLFYLFPDGRFVPRWTRWPTILVIGWSLLGAAFPRAVADVDNSAVQPLAVLILAVSIGAAQIYRYRRVADATQRQQTKWVAGSVAVVMVTLAVIALTWIDPRLIPAPDTRPAALAVVVLSVALPAVVFLLPLSLTVAILRYRLWDVDIVIRRTLVYGALIAALTVIYLGGVALLQRLLGPIFGTGNQPSVVGSTLAIVALSQPLRARIQRGVDHRFYRHRYDARRTLASFGATLRDETDMERIGTDLLDAARETVRPAHASLWLRPPQQRAALHTQPPPRERR